MSRIQIETHHEKRIICIWLTKSESADAAIQSKLTPIFKQYQPQKYMVAVFRSGEQDLRETTSELLQYNRRLSAEREVQSEKMKTLSV